MVDFVKIKEVEYPTHLDWELVEKWAESIPVFSSELIKTPVISIDLGSKGVVYVKNEGDKRINPTGTIKDRAARKGANWYKGFAERMLSRKNSIGEKINTFSVPYFSYITAGNFGKAFSEEFKKHGLPPINLLVDSSMKGTEKLKKLYANIFEINLSDRALSTDDIKKVFDKYNVIDLTSINILETHSTFYDGHVHEAFNQNPNGIYVPRGSGRLMENYLILQCRNAENKDPRLKIPVERVTSIDIFGAEPEDKNSIADKLTTHYNPFTIFDNHDIEALNSFSFTGQNTGIYKVPEKKIKEAYDILIEHMSTSYSGSTALGKYLLRFEEGKIDPKKKSLIINTGRGV